MRAWYYDPTTAQFLTVDPLLTLTRSAYGYVDGNPLNGTDPSGLCALWCKVLIGAVAVAVVACAVAEPCGIWWPPVAWPPLESAAESALA